MGRNSVRCRMNIRRKKTKRPHRQIRSEAREYIYNTYKAALFIVNIKTNKIKKRLSHCFDTASYIILLSFRLLHSFDDEGEVIILVLCLVLVERPGPPTIDAAHTHGALCYVEGDEWAFDEVA